MEKGNRIEAVNGEIPLPEDVIQHIQSFMSEKEAARTTVLSKSWYNAWLTRPVLDFDTHYFHKFRSTSEHVFMEFAKKTMERYQNLSLKIDSFSLCSYGGNCFSRVHDWNAINHNLIVGAMKMGATTVQLRHCKFALPQEVLGSETLLKLSLTWCKVGGNYAISCSRLRSLTLKFVDISSGNFFKGLISCCILMEELSISNCRGLWENQFELHKLRRLLLHRVNVNSIFFTDFSSRFPSLKDLSIVHCYGFINIHIASTSLETICFGASSERDGQSGAKFDVPNIRKFTYSCFGLLPPLSINGPSREWEFDISISFHRYHKTSWFLNLKKLLKRFTLSRISLSINLDSSWFIFSEHEVDVEVVPKPLVVDNLMIKAPCQSCSQSCTALVVRSLGAFRPMFITDGYCDGYAWIHDKLNSIVSHLEDKFGQFGLKKVNVEIYDEFDAEWRLLELKEAKADSIAKVRLQLIWVD